METRLDNNRIRLESSDWRWSATIVGIVKYFQHYKELRNDFVMENDYIEFQEGAITDERYLLFAESEFNKYMHHKIVEEIIGYENPTEEQIKFVNEKLSKNTSSNTVMLKTFKGIKFDGSNAEIIQKLVNDNRLELIRQTFRGGRALYYNFCNENNMMSDKGKSCRIRGYSVDMGKKSKSVSFMRDKNTFVYQDSRYFDFIPFAFSYSKTREAFFVNNNFTIDQLLKTNKNEMTLENNSIRSKLFFKIKDSSTFIDYDVEIIKKEREKEYFETIFVRKSAIKLFEKITEKTQEAITKPCNAKRNENSQDEWLNIESIVVDSILNEKYLDDILDKLFKTYNNFKYLRSHLITINRLLYKEDKMSDFYKDAQNSANAVKKVLRNRTNKLRAYEQRLISAITLKDYDRVKQVLLHLSTFTQVKMNFLVELFKDFDGNKNLAYTFINELGLKSNSKKVEGDEK